MEVIKPQRFAYDTLDELRAHLTEEIVNNAQTHEARHTALVSVDIVVAFLGSVDNFIKSVPSADVPDTTYAMMQAVASAIPTMITHIIYSHTGNPNVPVEIEHQLLDLFVSQVAKRIEFIKTQMENAPNVVV